VLPTELFDFLERIDACEARNEIAALLDCEIAKLGFHGVGMGWLPPSDPRKQMLFELRGFSQDFHNTYALRHYYRHSPVVRHMQSTYMPFKRSTAPYDRHAEPLAHRVMMLARDVGMDDAWVVPVHEKNELRGWICTFSDWGDVPYDKLRQLQLMGLWAHSRAARLPEPDAAPRLRLSRREREVVAWLARGKTADDIAEVLRLSPRTVEYHIANASLKLGTSNRIHTVVAALRLKQIVIGDGMN
jgi:LuxR family quorum sensing-dependent transcriptional regulator